MTAADSPLNCPACKQRMVSVQVGRVTIDVCKLGCKGIWFDARELQAVEVPTHGLAQALGDALTAPYRFRPLTPLDCPRCCTPLRTQIYRDTGVSVDLCFSCGGYFLDAGELRQIQHQYANLQEHGKAALEEEDWDLEPQGAAVRKSWSHSTDYKGTGWVPGPDADRHVTGYRPDRIPAQPYTPSVSQQVFSFLGDLADALLTFDYNRDCPYCGHQRHYRPYRPSAYTPLWRWFL